NAVHTLDDLVISSPTEFGPSQMVTVTGTVGTFTLSFNGQTTGTITASGLTASSLQTTLQSLSNVGAGNVSVVATSTAGIFVVTFLGTVGAGNPPVMIVSSTATATVAVTVAIGKAGAGTLEMTANNSALTGGFTVSAGTLAVGAAGALGPGTGSNIITLAGGTLRSDSSSVSSLSNNLRLTASSTVGGFNPLSLTGTMTVGAFTLTNLDSGGLTLGTSGPQGAITFANTTATAFTLAANFDAPVTMNGTFLTQAATGQTLTKTGTGTLTMNVTNAEYFNTTVSAGTLLMTNGSAFGTTGTIPTITVANLAELDLDMPSGTIIAPYNFSITGVGFNGVPDGALRMLDNNPSAPDTLTLTGAMSLGSGLDYIGVDAGSANPTNPSTDTDDLVIQNGTVAADIISNVVNVVGGIGKVGYGTLTLGGSLPNTFTGGASVNQGTLLLSDAGYFALGGYVASGTPPAAATITVGDGGGLPGSDILRENTSGPFNNQLGYNDGSGTYAPNLVVGISGLFDMTNGAGISNQLQDTIGSLTLETGETESAQMDLGTGGGTLTVSNQTATSATSMTVSAFGATDSNAVPAYIQSASAGNPSNLNFIGVSTTWNINGPLVPNDQIAPPNADLLISAALGGSSPITQVLGTTTPGIGGAVWLGNANDSNFSGAITINAGVIDLVGATVVDIPFTINVGGTLVADNNNTPYTGISSNVSAAELTEVLTSPNNDYVASRFQATSVLNLAGGTFVYEGPSATTTNASSDIGSDYVPNVNLSGVTQSIFETVYNGGQLVLGLGNVTPAVTGATVAFVTGTPDAGVTPLDIAGSGNYQLNDIGFGGLTNFISYATIVNSAGLVNVVEVGGSNGTDLYAPSAANIPNYYIVSGSNTLANAPSGSNVLINSASGNQVLGGTLSVNSVTVQGSGISISGGGTLTTTEYINDGSGNTLSIGALDFGGISGQIFNAGTLAINSVITGTAGLAISGVPDTGVAGTPTVTFGAPSISASPYTGSLTITGGIVDVQDGRALGAQSSAVTATVGLGAQLELDGALSVGNVALSIAPTTGTLYTPLPGLLVTGTTT
ncbi:MAG TPA: autotransporter-associated beta strand repeat-containing protein, partial [Pirellulales bacterium]